jgi:hypothetical protein
VSVFIILVYTVGVKGRYKFWKRKKSESSSDDGDSCSRLTAGQPSGLSQAGPHHQVASPPRSEVSPHGSFARSTAGGPKSRRALEEILYRTTTNADSSQRTRSSPIGSSAPAMPLSAPSSSKTIGRMLLGKSKLSSR